MRERILSRACLQYRAQCSTFLKSSAKKNCTYFATAVVLGVELRRQAVEQRVPEDGTGRSAYGVWGFARPPLHSSPLCGRRRAGDGPPRLSGPDGYTPASNLRILQAERVALTFQEGLLHQTVQHSSIRVESYSAGFTAHGCGDLQVSKSLLQSR